MAIPQDYDGPAIEFILRSIKPDNTADVIEQVLAQVPPSPAKLALYTKDQVDGDMTEQLLMGISERGYGKAELKEFMDKVHMTKI